MNSSVSLALQGAGMTEHQKLEKRGKDVPALASVRPTCHYKYHHKMSKKLNIKFKNNYNQDRLYCINVIQSLHC